jgi:hypothetical protein
MRRTLTASQMEVVRVATATLRMSARDAFLQALACELARGREPITDADVHGAIRSLLGATPTTHFIREDT